MACCLIWRKPSHTLIEQSGGCPACPYHEQLLLRKRVLIALSRRQTNQQATGTAAQTAQIETDHLKVESAVAEDLTGPSNKDLCTSADVHVANGNATANGAQLNQSTNNSSPSDESENSIYTIVINLPPPTSFQSSNEDSNPTVKMLCKNSDSIRNVETNGISGPAELKENEHNANNGCNTEVKPIVSGPLSIEPSISHQMTGTKNSFQIDLQTLNLENLQLSNLELDDIHLEDINLDELEDEQSNHGEQDNAAITANYKYPHTCCYCFALRKVKVSGHRGGHRGRQGHKSSTSTSSPPMLRAHSATMNTQKSERKAARTLTAILLAFIITWTPYNVLGMC